jgi:hypothetical protein
VDFGYIAIAPAAGAAGANSGFVITSNNALNAATIDLNNAPVNTVWTSNSEYDFADFGANLAQYRIVGVGVRIRNITPALTKGGQCIGLAEPSHSVITNMTTGDFDAYSESARHSAKDLGSWIQLVWRPVDSDDADFQFTFPTPAVGSINGFCMGFIIVPPAGSPQTYEFEAYGLYEIQGKNVTSKRFSIADTSGFEATSNAVVQSTNLYRPHVRDPQMVSMATVASEHILNNEMSATHSPPAHLTRAGSKVSSDKGDIKAAIGGISGIAATGIVASVLGFLGL